MVTIEELDRLVALMREARLVSLLYADGGESVRLEFEANGSAQSAGPDTPVAREPQVAVVASEGLGEFLDRHPTEDQPLVKPGDRISVGEIVGYLKVGLVLSPIVANISGTVRQCLVENGSRIGFGTPVLEIVQEQ